MRVERGTGKVEKEWKVGVRTGVDGGGRGVEI